MKAPSAPREAGPKPAPGTLRGAPSRYLLGRNGGLRTSVEAKVRATTRALRAGWGSFVGRRSSPLLAVVAVSLGATGLRLYRLGEWSFWIDEILSIRDSLAMSGPEGIAAKHYPLFYMLIHPVLANFGVNEWTARIVPTVVGSASIPLLYLATRRMVGRWTAVLACLLLAISPWHLYWSQNARFYTLILLVYNMSLFLFFHAVDTGSWKSWAAATVLCWLGLAVHPTAAVLIPTFLIYFGCVKILPFAKPPGLRARSLIPLVAVPVLLYGAYEAYRTFHVGRASLASDLVRKFIGQMNVLPIRLLYTVVYDIGIPLMCLGLLTAGLLLARRRREGVILVLGSAVPVIGLLIVAVFSFAVDRYVFFTLPSWALLGALGVKEMVSSRRKDGVVFVLAVVGILVAEPLGQDILYFTYQNGNRADWKGAYAYVQAGLEPGDMVVSTRPPIGVYYLRRDVISTYAVTPESLEADGQRVWFVIGSNLALPRGMQAWLDRDTELVAVLDVHLPGKTMEMRVYLYDPTRQAEPGLLGRVPGIRMSRSSPQLPPGASNEPCA